MNTATMKDFLARRRLASAKDAFIAALKEELVQAKAKSAQIAVLKAKDAAAKNAQILALKAENEELRSRMQAVIKRLIGAA